MKCGLVVLDDHKQIMFWPETEREREILKCFAPGSEISLMVKEGEFHDKPRAMGFEISMCQGGYIRAFQKESAIMLVIVDKPKVQEA